MRPDSKEASVSLSCAKVGRRVARWAFFGWACLVLLPGCRMRPVEKTLVLYCGAGIRPPAEELADAFGRAHGVTVECDFAGSEVLLSRIKLTRSGDVYLPGDAHYVDLAAKEDLIAESRTICYFVPVLLVAKGNPKGIRTLADLSRPGVRVGLGDPEACAIGRKAVKILAKNGISLEDIAGNVAFRSLTVNELGDKVKLGALDVVIVWDATAAYYADSAEAIPIPVKDNVISTVPAAVLTTSDNPELARQLMEYLASEQGRSVFAKYHYSVTKPE